MELYTYYQSGASYRVRIALNLKGLTPEQHFVDLTKGEQQAEGYASLNPQRMVPYFIDGEAALSQSLAIMEYLDEAYPNTHKLLPGNAAVRAHIRALALSIATDISPLGNLKVRKYLQGPLGQTEEVAIEFIRHWIKDGFDALEKTLSTSKHTGTFCVGDTPTLVDCCLMPQVFAANRWKLDLSSYPTINRIAQACEAHPAFIAAHPLQQPDAKK